MMVSSGRPSLPEFSMVCELLHPLLQTALVSPLSRQNSLTRTLHGQHMVQSHWTVVPWVVYPCQVWQPHSCANCVIYENITTVQILSLGSTSQLSNLCPLSHPDNCPTFVRYFNLPTVQHLSGLSTSQFFNSVSLVWLHSARTRQFY